MREEIKKLVEGSQKILVIQADNPDADSLASSLALEQILGEMGKEVSLYCGIDMPGYLKYLAGWDRVSGELPKEFDLSIIVDASTMTLFGKLAESGQQKKLAGKPCIVLDHHAESDNSIPFAAAILNDPEKSSTGELIYHLAKDFDWPLDNVSAEFIMTSILGDTQGLGNDLATAGTYRVMAELIDMGADRPKLEELRRGLNKMPEAIFRYKAKLIERTELHADGKLAIITIPHQEIMDYSPLFNPNALIQNEQLQTEGVGVSVAIKNYTDGRITAGIRCNHDSPIAAKLAEHFGGGGHEYSAGFKLTDNKKTLGQVKSECVQKAAELLK